MQTHFSAILTGPAMHMDSLIFILFLLISLLVGIRSTMHATIQTTRFATAHIITAILAITYGGEVLCYPFHIGGLLSLTGSAMSYFIIGTLLAHRLHLFLNNRSVAEIMGQLYGNSIQKIVAICGICYSVAIAAIQCKLLGMALCWCFAMPADYSLLISMCLIVCSIGSNTIQSLALASVVRCAAFGLLLPTIAWALWKGMVAQYNADPINLALAVKRSWHNLIHSHGTPLGCMAYFVAFAIPAFYPAQVTPILMAQNATQIKRSLNGAGFFSLSINLLLLWVALLAQHHSDKWMLSAIALAGGYTGLKGLFMVGVAALTISTAGANLHAATGLMTNDLPNLFKGTKKPIICQIIVGIMALLLVQYTQGQMMWKAIVLFKSVVSLPLLLALIGISLHPYAVLMGMLAGGITGMARFYFVPHEGVHSLLPAIMMNLLTMMGMQLLQSKQKTNPPDITNGLTEEPMVTPPSLWRRWCRYICIKHFNLWNYLQLPKDSLPYILFSFYILLTGYGALYTFSSNLIWDTRLEALILFPSLFVATFFLTYTSISPPPYVRKVAAIIWPLSHIYFLFLVGTGMAMLSKFAHLHDIILIFNLCLSIFISPLIVLLLGCVLSAGVVWVILHYMDCNNTLITCFLDLNLNIIYAILMLFVFVGGLLYYNRALNKRLAIIQALTNEQEEQNGRQFFNKQQVEALAYESSYIISQLNHQLIRLEQSKEAFFAYADQAIRLKKYFNSIFQHLKHNLHLVTNWISIDQLLAQCFDSIKISNIYDTPYVMIHTKHLYIQCAIENIKNLIISSLYSCSTHESLHSTQRKDIYMYIDDTQLGYRLTLLQGKLQKINAISFVITTAIQPPAIRPIYKVAEMADIQILDENKEKIDSENQHIVHAHYGYYERLCSEAEITHLYVIPVNVKEITKAFATLSPVVYTQKMVLDPVNMKEETAFLERVKKKKGIHLDAVMDALQLIKVYYTTQRRKTGELFYLHPMAVASILLTITDDSSVIIAGLVHDIIQNTPFTEAGLTTLFGASITQIVLTAACLEKLLPHQKEDYATYIKQIMRSKNHNALLVRLADVLHNARTISGHTIEKQIEKSKLIQTFYLPLATQLQLVNIAHELALHSEKVLHLAMVKD